jgi:23S rRNA pseudouridine2605 synthase
VDAHEIPKRLDKYLREATRASVVVTRTALASGQVRVNDARATDPRQLVFANDRVTYRGTHVVPRTDHVYLMLNKPIGVTSSARDPDGHADLAQFLEQMPAGVFPIGRLDRMTSGLLLFTTDGDLAHAVLHPAHHTEKLYWLWLNECVADDDPRLSRLTDGVSVLGRITRAVGVTVLCRGADFTELHLTLNEGQNRQIRKLARALDLRLQALHRKAIGTLELGGLLPGQFRELSPEEVAALWQCTGGRSRVVANQIAALARLAEACRSDGAPHARLEAWLGRNAAASC